MTQKEQAKLITTDAKFEPSRKCQICGLPTRTAAVKCLRCLEALYLKEELIYTSEWLQEHPGVRIELGHDSHRLLHMVLFRPNVRNLSWCGVKISQVKAKRTMAQPGMFPPEICVQCLKAYEGMGI